MTARKDRFHGLRDQGLQRIGFERQPNPGCVHDDRSVAGDGDRDLLRADEAFRRLDARHTPVRGTADRRHGTILDDVDAARRCAAGVPPGDGVMPRRAGAPLQRRSNDRVTGRRRNIERRAELLRLLRRQPLVVDAIQAVRMDVALEGLDIVNVVREHHHAALGIHDVVVQILGQRFPKIERAVIKTRALVIEVVRADDSRVATRVAAAEPALVDHRDIGDPMLLREVVCRTQAVPAGADDHHVVSSLGLGIRPLLSPVRLAR